MNICFIDLSGIDFNPFTPDLLPLGGMQSGVCYLSRELKRRGHDVVIYNQSNFEGNFDGIQVFNFQKHFRSSKNKSDIYVSISCSGRNLRSLVGKKPLILFTGHNKMEPSMQVLENVNERDSWDHFVFKSNWQADSLRNAFSLDASKISIITNGVSPAFEALRERTSYYFLEERPPIIYFSSTPFRGLDILAMAYPKIKQVIPDITAKIYSSMAPYHSLAAGRDYSDLYARCRELGMEYIGSLSQPNLAKAVATADALAFPSTYAETSCITLMEAMANSALIISRDLGAIKETSAGFAHIMRESSQLYGDDLVDTFAKHVSDVLQLARNNPERERKRLAEQRAYCLANYSWVKKAEEWEMMLQQSIFLKQESAYKNPHYSKVELPIYNYLQTIDGHKLYIDPTDGRAKRLLDLGGDFNAETRLLWKAALAMDEWNVIIDVGANYGEMLFEPRLSIGELVLAVEPNPRILPYLKKTISSFQNIKIVEAALTNSIGERRFTPNDAWSGMSRLAEGPNAIDVKTTTVDRLIQEYEAGDDLCFLLKIDVEGGELEVLEGAAESINKARNYCFLVEVSHLEQAKLAILESRYAIKALNIENRKIEAISSFAELKGISNLWQQDVLLMRK